MKNKNLKNEKTYIKIKIKKRIQTRRRRWRPLPPQWDDHCGDHEAPPFKQEYAKLENILDLVDVKDKWNCFYCVISSAELAIFQPLPSCSWSFPDPFPLRVFPCSHKLLPIKFPQGELHWTFLEALTTWCWFLCLRVGNFQHSLSPFSLNHPHDRLPKPSGWALRGSRQITTWRIPTIMPPKLWHGLGNDESLFFTFLHRGIDAPLQWGQLCEVGFVFTTFLHATCSKSPKMLASKAYRRMPP